jgi:thiamine pyrophosphate-dependent acetolactate synthase large subunit-like protein
MVRQWQDLFYDQNYSYTDIGSPDYKKIAEAYRIR